MAAAPVVNLRFRIWKATIEKWEQKYQSTDYERESGAGNREKRAQKQGPDFFFSFSCDHEFSLVSMHELRFVRRRLSSAYFDRIVDGRYTRSIHFHHSWL